MHAACQRRAWKKKQPKRPANQPTPFDLGWHHAALHWAAVTTGKPPPGGAWPFAPGTPEHGEFNRGLRAAMTKFSKERNV